MLLARSLLTKYPPAFPKKSILSIQHFVYHEPPSKESATFVIPKFPPELLIAVVDFVYGRKELYQLCRTSRFLRKIAEPKLYFQHFGQSELAKQMDIPKILRHPQLESLLNTLYIKLKRPDQCEWKRSRLTDIQQARTSQPACSCSNVDEQFWISIASLLNLRTLKISCRLCVDRSSPRHQHICKLETRLLKKVFFTCQCSIMDDNTLAEIFSAACMNSVITLGWHLLQPTSIKGGALESRLVKDNVLPKLRHLDHWGRDVDNLLLRHRPITRLCSSLEPDAGINHEDLRAHREIITHINIHTPYIAAYDASPLAAIAREVNLFRNLHHIGAFPLNSKSSTELCEELHAILTQFIMLRHLVSIEASISNENYKPNERNLRNGLFMFSKPFPSLSRIFLRKTARKADVWTSTDFWQRQLKDRNIASCDHLDDWDDLEWRLYLSERW
ncbi:hypothetical protein CPB86DRAFT_781620 [Serendipita vermifera]|nr:hypothetical protein CPB86DRAFT_781620 [Serendipita vermifera]